jgi:hypothetical protein
MMVYNTQNHWVRELCSSPGILNNYKTTFRILDLFPPSSEGRETTTLLDSSERANLNNTWTSD